MSNKVIKFSAGHGKGREFNRGGVSFNEGDQNKIMTDAMVTFLQNNYSNVSVSEIRRDKGNIDHSLSTRSAYGAGADLYYSWHTNAGDAKVEGVEAILSYQSLAYYDFAVELVAVIARVLETKNRGVKFRDYNTMAFGTISNARSNQTNYYGELRNNKAKCAILVEHVFHTNYADSKKYVERKDILVREISKLIAKYFGLIAKGSTQIKPNNGNISTGNKVKLASTQKIYMNANDAINSQKSNGTFPAGEYYVYKKVNGATNITKKAGEAGGWVKDSSLSTITPQPSKPQVESKSIFTKKGDWYYYIVDGKKRTGFHTIGKYTYYFREKTGTQAFGFQYINNAWYYFREGSGTMATGWQYINKAWYYFRDNGTRVDGFQFIDKKWRYFNNNGQYKGDVNIINKTSPK